MVRAHHTSRRAAHKGAPTSDEAFRPELHEPFVHTHEAFRYAKDGNSRTYNLRVTSSRMDVWVNLEGDEPLRTEESRTFTEASACSDWLRSEKRRLEAEGWVPV